jgi:CDP-diacylglycerol--glycerol-3-phosphate 3-phosphatidyltransferase
VSFWVPLVVITRGFLTDTIRTLSFEQGKTPFGEKTMMRSTWSRFLVSSRFMRALYGGAKVAAFCALGARLAAERGIAEGRWPWGAGSVQAIAIAATALTAVTVFLCVVRGVPVLWDGREVLRRQVPRTND